jgi:2-desacetyl-2-hydroxyethyl bacteriochlorophyllide A dehydrogenase
MTMFAAKLVGPKKFEIFDKPAPDIETAPPGSVVVRMRRATICGSDVPYYLGLHDKSHHQAEECFPAHECVGEVVASNTPKFKAGDTVLSQPDFFTGLGQFFMARDWRTVHIPADGNWGKWLMAQPLGTVIWGMRKVGAMFHQNVVVLGQGAMGLLSAQMCSCLGAKTIIVVDPHPNRLAISAATGATHTLTNTDASLFGAVRDILGDEPVDMVVEAVGHQTQTVNTALRLVKNGGTILAYGVPDIEVYPIDYNVMFRKNVRFITTVIPDLPHDFASAVNYIKTGRVVVDKFVTHEFSFNDLEQAFELFHSRHDNVLKVMLNYDK